MGESTRTHVMRWGRSAYERDTDLAAERQQLEALGFDVRYEQDPAPDLSAVEALVVHSKKRVTDEIMAQAPRLSLIMTTTSGYDHIDVDAAAARGIPVARSPLARRDAVLDASLAMALALMRDFAFFRQEAQTGTWARGALPTRDIPLIRGLQVGIIGYGVIGQAAAQMWTALGADVQIHDPAYPELSPLSDVLGHAQLVTLHCSLTPSSTRLIDAETLAQLPRGAILLNTARGGSVDVDAALAALDSGQLGGLGLDVFPEEPYPQLAALASRPGCVVTPHAAGYHRQLGAAITHEVVSTLTAWQQGRPLPHPVSSHH